SGVIPDRRERRAGARDGRGKAGEYQISRRLVPAHGADDSEKAGGVRLKQLAAEDRDRLAAELHTVARDADPDDPAARGGLVANELGLAQARLPERPERAVRPARTRLFGDARARREEARDEVVGGRGGPTGDDHTAYG